MIANKADLPEGRANFKQIRQGARQLLGAAGGGGGVVGRRRRPVAVLGVSAKLGDGLATVVEALSQLVPTPGN